MRDPLFRRKRLLHRLANQRDVQTQRPAPLLSRTALLRVRNLSRSDDALIIRPVLPRSDVRRRMSIFPPSLPRVFCHLGRVAAEPHPEAHKCLYSLSSLYYQRSGLLLFAYFRVVVFALRPLTVHLKAHYKYQNISYESYITLAPADWRIFNLRRTAFLLVPPCHHGFLGRLEVVKPPQLVLKVSYPLAACI